MEAADLIGALREQIDEVAKAGNDQIQVSSLRAYLDALERDAGTSAEHQRLQHAGMLAQHSADSARNLEVFKALLETGKNALQTLVVINGGAVIALLGVMSNLIGKEGGDTLARYLALPLLEFGLGVLCGAVGFALRYFSQACYSASIDDKDRYEVWGDCFRWAAITVALTGFILFGFAIANAYNAVLWSFAR